MKIKTHIFEGTCKDCGESFQFQSGFDLYNEKLFLSLKTHLPAIVIHDEDAAFKEAWEMVKIILFPQELLDSELVTRFGRVFGQVCDAAPDGSHYDASGRIYCPSCGSANVGYGPTNPPISREVDAPILTHAKWNAMSSEGRMAWLRLLLESYNY
jgi:hypothetical protein